MRFLAVGLIAIVASGCFPVANGVYAYGVWGVLSDHEERIRRLEEEDEEPEYVAICPGACNPAEPAPSLRSAPVDEESIRPFDIGAAHGALAAVDVSDCWEKGTMRGYGHARVTFQPTGRVSLVEITNPEPGLEPSKACVSERYHATTVPPFRGSPTAVATSFYVG